MVFFLLRSTVIYRIFLVNLVAIFTYFQKFCNFLLFNDDNYVLSPPGQFPVLKVVGNEKVWVYHRERI